MSDLCLFCSRAEGLPTAGSYCGLRFFALAVGVFFAALAIPAVVPALCAGAFAAADAPFFFTDAEPAGSLAEPFAEAVSCGFAPVPPLFALR